MKFSNVIIATASLVLVGLILDALLMVAFGPLNSSGSEGDALAFVIAFLVTSLVVGYVFGLKIQEDSRIKAIGFIVVLSALTILIFSAVWIANAWTSLLFRDELSSMFNTTKWTDYDWASYSAFMVSVNVIIAIVVTFIGLYAGSMLRKPSAKPKE